MASTGWARRGVTVPVDARGRRAWVTEPRASIGDSSGGRGGGIEVAVEGGSWKVGRQPARLTLGSCARGGMTRSTGGRKGLEGTTDGSMGGV